MALEGGDGFEIDLQLLKSGHVIILHDDSLWRTAAVSWLSWLLGLNESAALISRPVGELTYEEARAVQVGDSSHAEPTPSFTEALYELRNPPPYTNPGGARGGNSKRLVHCFAEIKAEGAYSSASFDPQLTRAAAAAVTEANISPSQLTWISFSLGALVDIKQRLPEHAAYLIAYVATAAEAASVARRAVGAGLDGIDLNASPSVVTAELADWLHARGKRLAVWVWRAPGANDVASVWEHMERCGVDYFTSNLPFALHEWRASARPA